MDSTTQEWNQGPRVRSSDSHHQSGPRGGRSHLSLPRNDSNQQQRQQQLHPRIKSPSPLKAQELQEQLQSQRQLVPDSITRFSAPHVYRRPSYPATNKPTSYQETTTHRDLDTTTMMTTTSKTLVDRVVTFDKRFDGHQYPEEVCGKPGQNNNYQLDTSRMRNHSQSGGSNAFMSNHAISGRNDLFSEGLRGQRQIHHASNGNGVEIPESSSTKTSTIAHTVSTRHQSATDRTRISPLQIGNKQGSPSSSGNETRKRRSDGDDDDNGEDDSHGKVWMARRESITSSCATTRILPPPPSNIARTARLGVSSGIVGLNSADNLDLDKRIKDLQSSLASRQGQQRHPQQQRQRRKYEQMRRINTITCQEPSRKDEKEEEDYDKSSKRRHYQQRQLENQQRNQYPVDECDESIRDNTSLKDENNSIISKGDSRDNSAFFPHEPSNVTAIADDDNELHIHGSSTLGSRVIYGDGTHKRNDEDDDNLHNLQHIRDEIQDMLTELELSKLESRQIQQWIVERSNQERKLRKKWLTTDSESHRKLLLLQSQSQSQPDQLSQKYQFQRQNEHADQKKKTKTTATTPSTKKPSSSRSLKNPHPTSYRGGSVVVSRDNRVSSRSLRSKSSSLLSLSSSSSSSPHETKESSVDSVEYQTSSDNTTLRYDNHWMNTTKRNRAHVPVRERRRKIKGDSTDRKDLTGYYSSSCISASSEYRDPNKPENPVVKQNDEVSDPENFSVALLEGRRQSRCCSRFLMFFPWRRLVWFGIWLTMSLVAHIVLMGYLFRPMVPLENVAHAHNGNDKSAEQRYNPRVWYKGRDYIAGQPGFYTSLSDGFGTDSLTYCHDMIQIPDMLDDKSFASKMLRYSLESIDRAHVLWESLPWTKKDQQLLYSQARDLWTRVRKIAQRRNKKNTINWDLAQQVQ
ncbi:hypothetical protein BG004_007415 [Podila humilis]|nr:hypothetical protein BG004_007415 [Podila humilis]